MRPVFRATLFVSTYLAATALGFLSLSGCDRGPAWKKNSFVEQDLSRSSQDVELPASLWSKIEGLIQEGDANAEPAAHDAEKKESAEGHEGKSEHGEGGHESSAGPSVSSDTLPTEFSQLKVYLIEKNRGVLGRENIELKFSAGGGEMDLSDFVRPLRGSFYFVTEFMPDVEGVKTHVFFLSNNILRRKGDDVLGSGCHRYFDVTSAFAKAMKGDGFLVNTTDARHVSALAGTYFFAAVHEGKLHLASLNVKDSSQRALHCRR